MASRLENWSYRKFKAALDKQYLNALANLADEGAASVNWIIREVVDDTYKEVWPTISRYSAGKTMEIIPDLWKGRVDNYIKTSMHERLTDVWTTSKKEYVNAVNDAIAVARNEGLGVEATTRRIEKLVKGKLHGTINKWRARRIAHTETVSALNYGTWQGQVDAVANGADIRKEWITYMDGKERASHAEVNGQVRDVDQPFDVGGEKLMFPGDPTGSAENVINCRCNTQPTLATKIQ